MRQNAFSIYKKIQAIPGTVFDIADAAHVLGKNRKDAAVYLKKMVDSGIIFRVCRGLYSKVDDAVVIAGNLPFPSYITGLFALFYYGEGEAPSVIDVTSTVYKKDIPKWNIRFHKVKLEYFGDFKHAGYTGYTVKIATREQALKEMKKFGLKAL